MTLRDSLNYIPNDLKFGTSGLRGLLSDMTDLECYINTAGFIRFLKNAGESVHTIYIAGDLRDSTPHIMDVVGQAITDEEITVVNCGLTPTPALAYYALLQQQPCIMVTGSHIPDDRNGIKFYKSTGEVLKEDEPAIQESVALVRAELYAASPDRFNVDGSLRQLADLPSCDEQAEQVYISRHTDFFAPGCLQGTKLVMYQHSSVSRDLLPKILRLLGADVEEAARSEKFIPIDTENIRPVDEVLFRELAKEYHDMFAIVSTDGDGDRPFVIDETGTFHRGDILGLVVSEFLGSEAVAFPISCNDAVVSYLDQKKIRFEYTKIGSPYVVSAMDRLKSEFTNVSGWEVNGGFLIGEDCELEGRVLKALPTRDAAVPIICALLDARSKGLRVSELFERLPRRYTQAGLIDNFPTEVSARMVSMLSKDDAYARAMITSAFSGERGFGHAVKGINSLDGIRILFENGEVAHLRPSGNAPQLRIYSNADSQERADEIVAQAIEEPHGVFRALESLLDNQREDEII